MRTISFPTVQAAKAARQKLVNQAVLRSRLGNILQQIHGLRLDPSLMILLIPAVMLAYAGCSKDKVNRDPTSPTMVDKAKADGKETVRYSRAAALGVVSERNGSADECTFRNAHDEVKGFDKKGPNSLLQTWARNLYTKKYSKSRDKNELRKNEVALRDLAAKAAPNQINKAAELLAAELAKAYPFITKKEQEHLKLWCNAKTRHEEGRLIQKFGRVMPFETMNVVAVKAALDILRSVVDKKGKNYVAPKTATTAVATGGPTVQEPVFIAFRSLTLKDAKKLGKMKIPTATQRNSGSDTFKIIIGKENIPDELKDKKDKLDTAKLKKNLTITVKNNKGEEDKEVKVEIAKLIVTQKGNLVLTLKARASLDAKTGVREGVLTLTGSAREFALKDLLDVEKKVAIRDVKKRKAPCPDTPAGKRLYERGKCRWVGGKPPKNGMKGPRKTGKPKCPDTPAGKRLKERGKCI
jgi:ribosomal protein S7